MQTWGSASQCLCWESGTWNLRELEVRLSVKLRLQIKPGNCCGPVSCNVEGTGLQREDRQHGRGESWKDSPDGVFKFLVIVFPEVLGVYIYIYIYIYILA